MANAPISLVNLSKEGPPEGLSEFNLAFLRKLTKKLATRSPNLTDIGQVLAVKVIGHLNLAKRNLVPAGFNQSQLSMALIKYFSESYFSESYCSGPSQARPPRRETPLIDGTAFAHSLTTPLIINEQDWPGTADQLIELVSQAIEKKGSTSDWLAQINAIGQSRLATGWAQEQFGESTQVFTPESIARHLAAEVFAGHSTAQARLLDPACGAGHLLIPAAEHWLAAELKQEAAELRPEAAELSREAAELAREKKLAAGSKPLIKEKLEKLLLQTITGLDVDATLLQLCGFAFYLFVRDQLSEQSEVCEMPLPRLFLSKAAAGSLTLGTTTESDWLDLEGRSAAGCGQEKLSDTNYSQIVMNPPYLSTRIMGDTTANFLRQYYPDSAGDLYTAFIELATRLLAPECKLAMIVQQSFLSVQRYRAFRLKLLEQCHITSCLTLGSGSFSARPGEKVNSAVLTLEKKGQPDKSEAKDKGHASGLRMIQIGRMENDALHANQITEEAALAKIQSISGNPFAFDCPASLASCFKSLPALSDIEGIAIVNGLFTCNNKKFVKLKSQIVESESHLYVPYDKGGGQKWYHQSDYRLLWPDNGENIRQYRKERGQSQALPGEEFYFKPGLTYSYIGTTGFKARLLSKNSIFDIASSSIFSNEIDLHYLLGFLNSSLTIYLLGVLNPTINFQIGDLRRLPFKAPTAEISTHVANLAKDAIELMRNWQESQTNKNTSDGSALDLLAASVIDAEKKIQLEIDTIICQLYEIDKATEACINENEWVVGSRKKLLK